MSNREDMPMLLTANDLQAMGFRRAMVYKILNSADVPVVKIGSRKFIQRDKFLSGWIARRYKLMLKHNDINIVGIDHGFGNLKQRTLLFRQE